jgi:citrate lyase subunit beta/citryl-CoA lyase
MVTPAVRFPVFVPGDRPDRYAKAAASGADAVIIDLEDAVAPAAKASARAALCTPGALPTGVSIIVRVNARGTPWHADDLAAIARLSLAAVMLPKSDTAEDITAVSACLGDMAVLALIETARGLANARAIAACSHQLAFGSIDYCADLGLAHIREALLSARSELVLASRLANLPSPIDGVTTSITDTKLIEDDARYAQQLGFGGKLCIHPSQIAPVRRGFAPSPETIAWAHKVLATNGDGAVSVDGAMVDAPVRARARQILDWA